MIIILEFVSYILENCTEYYLKSLVVLTFYLSVLDQSPYYLPMHDNMCWFSCAPILYPEDNCVAELLMVNSLMCSIKVRSIAVHCTLLEMSVAALRMGALNMHL